MNKSLNIGVFDSNLIYSASPMCGDNVFLKGFELNGFSVTRFDYRASNDPNRELIKTAELVEPDVFFFGKCEIINEETILYLRKKHDKSIFIKWGLDVRNKPTAFDLIHNKYMDWFFLTYGGEYLQLHLQPNMKGVCSILTFTDSDFFSNDIKNSNYNSDVLWTGRPNIGDNPMRNDIINSIYQNTLQKNYNGKLFGIDNNWLKYPEYLYAINGLKIGIGSNSFNRKKYSSDRLGNYMSCGTFYMTQYIEGLDECFTEGVDIEMFRTIEEMNEKIDYYLRDKEKRDNIAKAGNILVKRYFDYQPLVKNILYTVERGYSSYLWDDVYVN